METTMTILPSFKVKDPASAATHFIGVVYSIFLTPVLLIHASLKNANIITMVSLSIFMISMILLYSASTAYHTFTISPKTDIILKKIDHLMIFILIAGSYTPICLCVLPPASGIRLLTIVWTLAIIGMIIKLFWINCPKWFSSIIYIGMGWSCITSIPDLYHILPLPAFLWLLIGGLIYTTGGIIYAMKLTQLNQRFTSFGSHEIFHVLVMLGNLCHFYMVFQYIS